MGKLIHQAETEAALFADVLENLYNSIAVSEAVREGGRIVDFRYIYVNRAHEQHLGKLRADIIGRTMLQRYPGLLKTGLFEKFVRVVETGEPLDIEHRYEEDGLNLYIRLVVKKFGDGILSAFHDIARRKHSETEMRRLNRELEDRVEKRTTELSQAQARLQRALDAEVRSNHAKGEFLAMVSHDLRSPLMAIQGYVGLLEGEGLAKEQVEQLGVIDQCAEGLLRLLDDLLRFSRLEAGEFTLENEPFLLRPLLEETLNIFRPAARQKKLDLRVEADASLPTLVVGDAAQLRRILTNLVGNALKFTEKGHVIVRMRAEALSTDEPGWFLHGEVADTGSGLDPAVAQDLFLPYRQGAQEARRNNGGVGLGLAICRRLCELMKGSITLESALGRGTTFRFHVQLGVVSQEWKA